MTTTPVAADPSNQISDQDWQHWLTCPVFLQTRCETCTRVLAMLRAAHKLPTAPPAPEELHPLELQAAQGLK